MLIDRLLLNFVRFEPVRGRFGLYIEAGKGSFSRPHACQHLLVRFGLVGRPLEREALRVLEEI